MQELQLYSKFAPTGFDSRGAFLHEQHDWLVAPVTINRDSNSLDESNWTEQLSLLGGESDTVEVHRFGHWACGWFEIVIVKPNTPAHTIAIDILERLDNYPVLNEDAFSALEQEKASEYWSNMSVSERLYWCKRYDISIFAARHDFITDDDGELTVALAS